MAPQDSGFRDFLVELHARMAKAGSRAELTAGLGRTTYAAVLAVLAVLAVAMVGLLVRALMIGEFAGVLFIIGFAALFVWQVGGFVRRNQPRSYRFDALPKSLLP
jgi:Flp pilus assembly protein TadB